MNTFEVKAYVTISVPFAAEDVTEMEMDAAQDKLIDALKALVHENKWELDDLEIK